MLESDKTVDILRRYPEKSCYVVPELKNSMSNIDEPEAKASMIWILGSFGELLDDAPYILEVPATFDEEKGKERTTVEELHQNIRRCGKS